MIKELIEEGLSLIPLKSDKTPNLKSWTKYQKERITDLKMLPNDSIGVVCGEISGNLLVIDVDCKYDLTGFLYEQLIDLINDTSPGLVDKLKINKTVKGGYHLIFRCKEKPIGNKKLASRYATEEEKQKGDKQKVLVETRGEGGYICHPPMKGYTNLSGVINVLTDVEVNTILDCCKSFNEIEVKEPKYNHKIKKTEYIKSPFEDYNLRGDCVAELQSHGWTIVSESNDRVQMKRPGETESKTSGNYSKEFNKFKVFSTSSEFDAEVAYSPVAVYCKLNHKDNWKECAKDLTSKDYGQKKNKVFPKFEKTIKKLKAQGYEGEDLQVEISKIHNTSTSEIKNNIRLYEENLGKEVSTFWQVEMKQNGSVKIDILRYEFCKFLNNELNIWRYKVSDADNGFAFVRLNKGIVSTITVSDIKKEVKDYLEGLDLVFDGVYRDQLLETMYRHSNVIFSANMLEFVECADIQILRSTKDTAYFPFKNGVVEISPKFGIQLIDYASLSGYHIWESSVIQHDFSVNDDMEGLSFIRFISKINNDDPKRIKYCREIVGYNIHDYRDPLYPISTVFGEETADSKMGGGAGKGILSKAISLMVKSTTIDGKSFDPSKEFAFQRVDVDTKLIQLQDTSEKFDFESLFSKTTDGFTIRRLFMPEIYVPFENSPKFLITTNHTVDNESVASKRRLKLLEFSSFYNDQNKPIDDLGETLFNSWDKETWNKFYNYMLGCALSYLEDNINDIDESKTSKLKRISTKYTEQFLEWFLSYSFEGKYIEFMLVYEQFLDELGYDQRAYSVKRFGYAVKFACEAYGIEYNKEKDPITRKLKVRWQTIGDQKDVEQELLPF